MKRKPSPPPPVIQWRTFVVESAVGKSARLVAFVLSTHMDTNGGSCYPSIARIEREAGLARSTVCVALNELEAARLILREPGGPPNRSTRYTACSPVTGLPVVRSSDASSPVTGHKDVHKDVQTSPAASRRRGTAGRRGRPGTAEAHPDSGYLDQAGAA